MNTSTIRSREIAKRELKILDAEFEVIEIEQQARLRRRQELADVIAGDASLSPELKEIGEAFDRFDAATSEQGEWDELNEGDRWDGLS